MTRARKTYLVSGQDAEQFLQGLITNDVKKLDQGLIYTAILTPQGKYIADFFLCKRGDAVLLDVDSDIADGLIKRLTMYRLRADVQITPADLHLHREPSNSTSNRPGDIPKDAMADPRNPALGWRAYRDTPQTDDATNWTALYVAHAIPQTGIELTADSFILEVGFEQLSGVDFKKGCYVGQEVTARMKHKTELRKGLVQVDIDGAAPVGSDITANGKPAGTLYSQSDGKALAYLRFDRASGPMRAGDAALSWSRRQ